MSKQLFPNPGSKTELESGIEFTPKFDGQGLIAAFITDAASGEPLMVGFMNATALAQTLETGEVHYWSRSRQELWHKGATSGNVQKVAEIRTDCDQDALWIKVNVSGHGATCHTGKRSCFYRVVSGKGSTVQLEFTGDQPLFDPKAVYGK